MIYIDMFGYDVRTEQGLRQATDIKVALHIALSKTRFAEAEVRVMRPDQQVLLEGGRWKSFIKVTTPDKDNSLALEGLVRFLFARVESVVDASLAPVVSLASYRAAHPTTR